MNIENTSPEHLEFLPPKSNNMKLTTFQIALMLEKRQQKLIVDTYKEYEDFREYYSLHPYEPTNENYIVKTIKL